MGSIPIEGATDIFQEQSVIMFIQDWFTLRRLRKLLVGSNLQMARSLLVKSLAGKVLLSELVVRLDRFTENPTIETATELLKYDPNLLGFFELSRKGGPTERLFVEGELTKKGSIIMAWYRIPCTLNQYNAVEKEFTDNWLKHLPLPKSVALFTQKEGFDCFLTPEAAKHFPDLLKKYGAQECETPSSLDVRLSFGDESSKSLLRQ